MSGGKSQRHQRLDYPCGGEMSLGKPVPGVGERLARMDIEFVVWVKRFCGETECANGERGVHGGR